jgi:hypothetical protein
MIAKVWQGEERIRLERKRIDRLKGALRLMGVERMPWEDSQSPMADGRAEPAEAGTPYLREFRRARGPLSEKIVYAVRLRACLPEGAPGGLIERKA